MPPDDGRQLSDAEHRREAVLIAARAEFAEWGYHGATTAAIAKRADISQPYIYALFPSKKALFISCQRRNHHETMSVIDAGRSASGEAEALALMQRAYLDEIEHREHQLFRLQATAAAASDADIAEEVRHAFIEGFERLIEVVGGDVETVKHFVSSGIFADTAMAIGLPRNYWPPLPAG